METWESQRPHQVPFPVQCPHPLWLNAGPFREEIPLVFRFTTSQSLSPPPDPCCLASEGWGLKLDLEARRINRKGRVGVSN